MKVSFQWKGLTSIYRKDQEIHNLSNRLEEEESLVANLKKKIKNLEARIEELEGELEAERQARVKVEKQRGDLNRDLEELSSQLDDTGNVAQAQVCIAGINTNLTYRYLLYAKR